MKIVHLTSVHTRFDARIYLKQCLSLSKIYEVSVIVADGEGIGRFNNISFIDVGKFIGRYHRAFKATEAIFDEALRLNGDVYHLHDPELIPIGLKLKKSGKKVIFDAHEDLPKQILTKHYIPSFLRHIISKVVSILESKFCTKFDGIVCATPFITNKFSKINKNVVNINNFPRVEELETIINPQRLNNHICYIGGISIERGISEILEALTLTKNDIQLDLAGKFHSAILEEEIKSNKGWKKTNFLGFVGRVEIKELLSTTSIGMVTLYPTISYQDSLPVKLFEYMCAGIPVIASNFPLWKEIVIKHNCGLCVDPQNPSDIANAIDYLIDNPDIAKKMGQNGFRAVQTEFNWKQEEIKLLKFYKDLLGN